MSLSKRGVTSSRHNVNIGSQVDQLQLAKPSSKPCITIIIPALNRLLDMSLLHKGSLRALYYLCFTIKLQIYKCTHRYSPTKLSLFHFIYGTIASYQQFLLLSLALDVPQDNLVYLNSFFFRGFDMLKVFQKCNHSLASIRNILEVHMHDNFINFPKNIFENA